MDQWVVWVGGGLVTVVGWFISREISAYDKRLLGVQVMAQNAVRRISVLDAEVESLGRQVGEARKDVKEEIRELRMEAAWLGDTMIAIGTRIGAQMPARPLASEFEQKNNKHEEER